MSHFTVEAHGSGLITNDPYSWIKIKDLMSKNFSRTRESTLLHFHRFVTVIKITRNKIDDTQQEAVTEPIILPSGKLLY